MVNKYKVMFVCSKHHIQNDTADIKSNTSGQTNHYMQALTCT